MKRSVITLLLGAVALTAGCPDSGDSGTAEATPYRDDWRTVINQPFSTYDADGAADIVSLMIGGTPSSDNFANRGDVIVRYAATDRITVEMRRFTMSDNEDLAEEDFDKLQIWAYDTTSSPKPPSQMDAEDNCLDPDGDMPWRDGCQVRVYYDGLTQVGRSGADLRVTLPNDFIFSLDVTTTDNDADSDYQNRGNVCVENLPGSADIRLGNGSAFVILDPNMNEMPECAPSDVAECAAAGWANDDCPCLGQGIAFSQTRVESNDAEASNVTVDIPNANFWIGYTMRNEGEGLTPGAGDAPGALCEATIDPSAGAVVLDPAINLEQKPWDNRGSINLPANGTPAAGYNITAVSASCSAVQGTEDPRDFVGKGLGSEQESEERGNLNVCSGCLRGTSCDDLIPSI